MAKIKPILFNTEMVRAILDGRKAVTRRVVKRPWYIDEDVLLPESGCCMHYGTHETHGMPYVDSIHRPGDILYVREPWAEGADGFEYKADHLDSDGWGWRPSIHMPREAARIFLRVTDVRVERLQDMQPYDIAFEGFRKQKDFIALWDSTIKPADRALYGWDANPWVWVIVFERINREEAGL